jgi:hypothetical protein
MLRSEMLRPPYEGAKPYFYIEDVDDREYLSELVAASCAELPEPRAKTKTKTKTKK